MAQLNTAARGVLRDAGITQAAWARAQGSPDGRWHGAACGCPDDKCAGSHHDECEECGCLSALVAELLQEQARRPR